MPNKTLSILDYTSIAEERLRGRSQEQVAKMFNVSVSLISKIEQSNEQYRQIQKDLLAAVIAEKGRRIAQPTTQVLEELEEASEAATKAIDEIEPQIQKSAEAATKAINHVEALKAEQMRTPIEAAAKVFDQIETLRTEVRKPAEAVIKAINHVETLRAEVRKPAEAMIKAFARVETLRTEVRKPTEAMIKVFARIGALHLSKIPKEVETRQAEVLQKAPTKKTKCVTRIQKTHSAAVAKYL